MARKKSITKRRRGLFLDKLRTSGSVVRASIAGEIGRSSWYDLKGKDTDFSGQWDDAEMEFLDKCEAESINRGVFGVVKTTPYTHIISSIKGQEDVKETRMHSVTHKSDRLLELTLKSRHPLYKPKPTTEQPSPPGGIAPTGASADLSNLTNTELEMLVIIQRKLFGSDA